MQAFQYLQNKNYNLVKSTFHKSIYLANELDELIYVESLINYSISLYLNGEMDNSYINLLKTKEISKKIYENSKEINQIYFIHLRCLGNMILISLNLNLLNDSKDLFNECIHLIKEPKKKNIKIQISMIRELLYIFFRFGSLDKYHSFNEKIHKEKQNDIKKELLQVNNNNYKLNDKTLYYLHKSMKENTKLIWIKYLDKEIKSIEKNGLTNNYLFLLLNKIAALYSFNPRYYKDDIFDLTKKLLESYYKIFGNELIIKDNKNLNIILSEFQNKFNTAIEYYQKLLNLEKELKMQVFELKINNSINKGNKIMVKILFRNALKNLNSLNNDKNNQNINEIKKQIEYTINLIEKYKINWDLLSIINIDPVLLKNINILFYNLKIIKIKNILRNYFNKYKLIVLGYTTSHEKMKNKYIKTENFLKKQFLGLVDGSNITKLNFNSNGYKEHFYKLSISNTENFLCVHKKLSDFEPYKKFNLNDLNNITVGFKSKNLINKFKSGLLEEYNSFHFLTLYFKERAVDLFFDNDEEMNKWFEGLYYFCKYVAKKKININLSYLFFTKLKLKILNRIKKMKYNLDIINQLKKLESKNPLEFQELKLSRILNLYSKICKEICK